MQKAKSEIEIVRNSITFRIRPEAEKLLALACRATGCTVATILNEAMLEGGPAVIARLQAEQAQAGREIDALLRSPNLTQPTTAAEALALAEDLEKGKIRHQVPIFAKPAPSRGTQRPTAAARKGKADPQ